MVFPPKSLVFGFGLSPHWLGSEKEKRVVVVVVGYVRSYGQ